jgi:GNAT superfamily N-acetyltransferase
MNQALIIRDADGARDMETCRALFQEYQREIKTDLCFQGFEDELRTLPGTYARPMGRLFLAVDGDAVAACVALRPLEPAGACEMKRLFVRPPWRGSGLGRRLAEMIVDEARAIGYSVMRLDTLRQLTESQALYRSMGFHEIPAYYFNPLEGVKYLELALVP